MSMSIVLEKFMYKKGNYSKVDTYEITRFSNVDK